MATTYTKISTVSRNYAKALLEVAAEDNSFDVYKSQLDMISNVLNSSEDLRIVMANSSISASKKIEILENVFKNLIDVKLLRFLKILVEKDRFNEFESIKSSFNEILEKRSNRKTVEIFSPIELDFENKTNVKFKLERKLNCEIVPEWKIDKSLIAGLAFKFDDTVIDTSICSKLAVLSKNITR